MWNITHLFSHLLHCVTYRIQLLIYYIQPSVCSLSLRWSSRADPHRTVGALSDITIPEHWFHHEPYALCGEHKTQTSDFFFKQHTFPWYKILWNCVTVAVRCCIISLTLAGLKRRGWMLPLPVQVLSFGETSLHQEGSESVWSGGKIHTALTTRTPPENCWLEYERGFDECAAFEYRRGVSPGASLKCHEGNIWMHRTFVHVSSSACLTRLDETYIFSLFFFFLQMHWQKNKVEFLRHLIIPPPRLPALYFDLCRAIAARNAAN